MTTDAVTLKPRSAVARLSRALGRRFGYGTLSERKRFALILLASTVIGLLQLQSADWLPRSAFLPVILLAGLFLPPRWLLAAFGYVLAWLIFGLVVDGPQRAGAIASMSTLGFAMVVMFLLSRSRSALGIYGTRSDRMLRDLRDRHREMAQLPQLPSGWRAESFVAAANGDSFSGDFLVGHVGSGRQMEFVVADVSGKGHRAGTRSMLLSGALCALIGQVEPDRYLPAANSYLVRARWQEGFASAAYVVIDAATGEFSVRSAGHPPVVQFHHQNGHWAPTATRGGPVLGVMEGIEFPASSGRLLRGDALLVYTDGVIESRTAGLDDGIDWMLGAAERARQQGFSGVPATLCGGARGGSGDDRAVLVVWRS